MSNKQEIIKYTTQELPSKNKLVNVDVKQTSTERALGILWDSEQDVLRIKEINKEVPNTKRGILSSVSSIFNPLGILTLVEPKCIIQDLWKQKIDWDHPIPLDILDRWQKWESILDSSRTIQIPRWCRYSPSSDTVELHVFSDSSSIAYGAVAYLRIVTADNIYCSFVMNKSRLAPIRNKTMTIPRLELQAAVLNSRLKVTIVEELKLNIDSVHLWSDPATVLKYIRNENVTFVQFIMYRPNEIRSNSNIQNWRFIPTELNVGDNCSRVIKHHTLTNKHQWAAGPCSFLISVKYRRRN